MRKPATKNAPKRAAGRKSATATAKRKLGRPTSPKGKAPFKKPAYRRASQTAKTNTSKVHGSGSEFIATTVSPPVKAALDQCAAADKLKRAPEMRKILVDGLAARGYLKPQVVKEVA